MEPFRKLLKALGFEAVVVVDEPDDRRPPSDIVEQKIKEADCVLVLLGPRSEPSGNETLYKPADWPMHEALFAFGKGKPLSLIIHQGTEVPELIRDLQSPSRFNFWDALSFRENVHHIVKHLLDFRRRVDFSGADKNMPFRFQRVENRLYVQRGGLIMFDNWYHEVVVTQSRDRFHHALTIGAKDNLAEIERVFLTNAYDLEARVGGDYHRVRIEPGKVHSDGFEYCVVVDPPLRPGEVFGYWRSFPMRNRLPLTRAQTAEEHFKVAGDPNFPEELFERRYFGEYLDSVYPADRLTLAIHFPRNVALKSFRAVVVEYYNRTTINRPESERCNEKSALTILDDPGSPERVLQLVVQRPLPHHSYYLQYETD